MLTVGLLFCLFWGGVSESQLEESPGDLSLPESTWSYSGGGRRQSRHKEQGSFEGWRQGSMCGSTCTEQSSPKPIFHTHWVFRTCHSWQRQTQGIQEALWSILYHRHMSRSLLGCLIWVLPRTRSSLPFILPFSLVSLTRDLFTWPLLITFTIIDCSFSSWGLSAEIYPHFQWKGKFTLTISQSLNISE